MNIATTKPQRVLLTPWETAQRLGLTNPNTLAVWRCTKRYELPYVKIGHSIRYDAADVERFIEKNIVRVKKA